MLYYIAINRDIVTHVSKEPLPAKRQEQLFREFSQLFASTQGRDAAKLFDALFTESEKVMFIKRIAIVLMLARGASTYVIARSLKVSDSTVRDIKKQAKAGKYDPIIATIKTDSFDAEALWKTVESLLRLGFPEQGKGRWQWLDALE